MDTSSESRARAQMDAIRDLRVEMNRRFAEIERRLTSNDARMNERIDHMWMAAFASLLAVILIAILRQAAAG